MRLRAGARVGPDEVLAVLGAGGMGEVYRARDTRLGREVALKVISDGAALMATGNGPDVEQLKQARALGLRPASLVIDGEVHSGSEPPHLLRAAIDRALARRSPPAR